MCRTSLFIVGSSTYAQILIVICIVAALSEVVTHNVPFLYFEVSHHDQNVWLSLTFLESVTFCFDRRRLAKHSLLIDAIEQAAATFEF